MRRIIVAASIFLAISLLCAQPARTADESVHCAPEPMLIHYEDVIACAIDPLLKIAPYFHTRWRALAHGLLLETRMSSGFLEGLGRCL